MLGIVFSPRAKRDLHDILTYIAEHNPSAALEYVDGIEDLCRNVLAAHPHVGRNKHGIPKEFLLFPYRNHVVIYEINAKTVDVLRVVHGAQDLRNLTF